MKTKLCIILSVALCTFAHSQTTEQEWQREAVRLYPPLGIRGTPLNNLFVSEHARLRSSSPEFFRSADWPVALAHFCNQTLAAPAVQAPAPRIQTYRPATGGILFDLYPGNAGPGKLTVHNGTNHNAICKIIDPVTNTKVCSFVILANTRDGISGVLDGRFRVIFAYGDSIIQGADRFESPEGFSEFKDTFDFVTTRTPSGIQYSTFSVTLHKVIGGNARTGTISADEYNKY